MDSLTTAVTAAGNTTGEVHKYTDLIHTYGASTVIIAVFIIGMIAMFGYILKVNQKTNNQLIKQQQQLLDLLLKREEEEKKPKPKEVRKEPNIIQMFLGINDNIKDILRDIYDDIDPTRVSVYVFHNGSYSSHGLPFFKASCICEMIRKNCGVTKSLNSHVGLPLQMFDNSISYLYKYGKMSMIDINDDSIELVKESPILVGMLKKNSAQSASAVSIYDHDNNILGILLAEFAEVHDMEFMLNIEDELNRRAPMLSPILEYSGIYKNNTDTTNN